MQLTRFSVIALAVASFVNLEAQQPAATDSSKTQPATSQQGAKPGEGDAVDAAKVSGSTFESRYFKFTCELPKGWKTLDDAARVSANAKLSDEEVERAHARSVANKKGVAKDQDPASSFADDSSPQNYSLMVASPNGVDSLASPVLPRINIWANKRIPPLDSPNDHIQFLLSGRRTRMLVRPQEVAFDGHSFVRASVITPNGEYHSQYVTVLGNYLVGFDFRADSERELVEMTEMMKSIRFQSVVP